MQLVECHLGRDAGYQPAENQERERLREGPDGHPCELNI
jgi:hypothetical protein